jgi:ketosteroid isomerase-like protein
MNSEAVSQWLRDYVAAWKSYDPQAIGALFSEDASYAWHPWDRGNNVARGRGQIVKAWLDNKDPTGTFDAEYRPHLIAGDQAIATGQTRYFTRRGILKRSYHNLFVMRFDDDGRCVEFTEWYMKTP